MEEKKGEDIKRKVDESWKANVEKEGLRDKAEPHAADKELPEATFTLFISGLMMEALIAIGDVENPVTKTKEVNLTHAKFIIDTIAMLSNKTKNNLAKDEAEMIEAVIYELRMRYVNKLKR